MSITVLLATGFDPWLVESKRMVWQSAGYFVTLAGTVRETVQSFNDGDFDGILVSTALAAEAREQILTAVRASGSSIPVVCVASLSQSCEELAQHAVQEDWKERLRPIAAFLASTAADSSTQESGSREMAGYERVGRSRLRQGDFRLVEGQGGGAVEREAVLRPFALVQERQDSRVAAKYPAKGVSGLTAMWDGSPDDSSFGIAGAA